MTTTTTTTTTTWDAARTAARINALGRELDLALRILNPDVARVVLADFGPAPAWTDFDSVFLNRAGLPGDVTDRRDLAQWVGAGLHELGHTLFSPRPGSDLWNRVDAMARTVAPSAHMALNVLEDQRQELALVARFAPVRGYFAALVVGLILDGGNGADAWPLVTGRTYLDHTTRAAVRAAWSAQYGPASAAAVARIVGAYQRLTDPADADAETAAALVLEFARVLGSVMPPTPCQPGGTGGQHGPNGDPVPTPEPTPGTTADDADDDLADDDDDDADPTGGQWSDDDDADATDADDDADGAGSDDDADGADDADADGGSTDQPDPADADDLADALADAVDDLLTDPDVARDLKSYRDAVDAAPTPAPTHWRDLDPTGAIDRHGVPGDVARSARAGLADVLAGLVANAEPGHIFGTDRGRINPARLIGGMVTNDLDPGSLFDRYDPGAMADVATDAVVALDLSGSMSSLAGDLSDALWTIAHAAYAADVALTVVGFGGPGDTVTLYDSTRDPVPGDRARVLRADGGSTDPRDAVGFALTRLTDRDAAPNRLFVIMTDGALDYNAVRPVAAALGAMHDAGIATGSYFMGYGSPVIGAGVEVVAPDLAALPGLFADLVADQIGQRLHDRG